MQEYIKMIKIRLPIRTTDNLGKKLALKQVAERAMSHIMQKSYRNDGINGKNYSYIHILD